MTLRAGLIGAGAMGRHHARILRHLDGVTLVGVADPHGDRYHAATGLPVLTSVSDLLRLGVDYCVIATPTSTHAAIAQQLAEARVAALIEKPLTNNLADATNLINAFTTTNTLAAVGHIERYNPAVQALHHHLLTGVLGDIYQVATRRQGRRQQRVADVGVVFDLAIHDIDLLMFTTGLRVTTITAHTLARRNPDQEDLLAAICELDHYAIGHHLVNRISAHTERTITVTGQHGCLIADTLNTTLTMHQNGRSHDTICQAVPLQEPLRAEHEAFRDALLGHPVHLATLAEATAAIAVAEAMLASARTRATTTPATQPLDAVHLAGTIPSSR